MKTHPFISNFTNHDGILVCMEFGSYVYGLDGPNSDKDYKGVYFTKHREKILGKKIKGLNISTGGSGKNSKNDVDVEWIEFGKFMNDLYSGQTYAIDMIFTGSHHLIESHPVWGKEIYKNVKFINKASASFLGYCRKQAAKYGLKGTRMYVLEKILQNLKGERLSENTALFSFLAQEHPDHVQLVVDTPRPCFTEECPPPLDAKLMVCVLGKKYAINSRLQPVRDSLQKIWDEYGERTRLAKENEGVDWKALSHAYRAACQLLMLYKTKEIKFPLSGQFSELGFQGGSIHHRIKNIKYGKVPFDEVSEELSKLIDYTVSVVDNSNPWEPYIQEQVEDFIYSTYCSVYGDTNRS